MMCCSPNVFGRYGEMPNHHFLPLPGKKRPLFLSLSLKDLKEVTEKASAFGRSRPAQKEGKSELQVV